jgi:cytochrome b6-f complex iron-sulfur subunit
VILILPSSSSSSSYSLQYAPTGAVVRGPAPLPLALAHIDTDEKGTIIFSTWSETDFRTEGKPWWI